MTYPGVGSLPVDPRRLRGDPQPPAASCHALVTASGQIALFGDPQPKRDEFKFILTASPNLSLLFFNITIFPIFPKHNFIYF